MGLKGGVRFAVLLSLAACGALLCGVARGDGGFHAVEIDGMTGYVVPEDYAEAHKNELKSTIPGPVRIEGFWTPVDTLVIVADHNLRATIRDAAKDPTLLFPDLPKDAAPNADRPGESLDEQRRELELVSDNYAAYARQYVGIVVDGMKIIFCNYSTGTKGDPAHEYIFTEKYFVADQSHFLQCRFDREQKTVSNVSMIGPWAGPAKN